ncbi:HAD-IIB family hydrolase [Synechococcus sp. RSCCF101]|uniref:HAD-IIB family hydrolase n=1 Tax=Synechococcus sp. RSCCF101 TaxID=2511069 RepID=UPI001245A692|nr:HAD-IIB family hydrolase [Synechococcus sp. RSCCF101]QEY31032.1 HAD-IIB family hydrolase [Synechococcus sp. RSCCF101]
MTATGNGTADWWVVTDLDGTLLDHRYDWSPAAATLAVLRQAGIPVIPCTSKTASEVRSLQREMALVGPAIVENGGAVLLERDAPERDEGLGPDSRSLHQALMRMADATGVSLTALVDLEPEQVRRLTGLGGQALTMAMERQWSMPFLPPPADTWPAVQAAAAAMGLKVLQGNRLAHLIGGATDKGLALAHLQRRLGAEGASVLALGDSPNDLALLEAADVAVVVPGATGPHAELQENLNRGRYRLAPEPHGAGWAAAVRRVLAEAGRALPEPG